MPEASSTNVVVVTATPLEGADVDARTIAAPVQTATAKNIEDSHALDLTAYMSRNLGSVHINDIQNNPLQPDVNYRGYTASPLLGTPQGLSVYMDGVRLNQPFGDVVSWDLIPREAIAAVTLMPGSNPLFGLNTLGGALVGSHEERQERARFRHRIRLWIEQPLAGASNHGRQGRQRLQLVSHRQPLRG